MADKSVLGIYTNREAVERATEIFVHGGFAATDISVLLPENLGTKQISTEKATKMPEGTATGATTGAVVGGGLGLLVGLGALAIPGLGPFIAAGPIIATLAGIGAGGAIGGFAGALIGMGIPEYEAKLYEGRMREGGILLAVHCRNADEVQRAKDLFRGSGAEHISSTGEIRASKTDATEPEREADREAVREAERRRAATR
jgi:hypothetical protein